MKSYRLSRCADVLVSKISPRRMAVILAILAVLGMGLVATPAAQAQAYLPQTLHSFAGPDGQSPPYGHLIADASGNLYGTTEYGGANGVGVVFELVRSERPTRRRCCTVS